MDSDKWYNYGMDNIKNGVTILVLSLLISSCTVGTNVVGRWIDPLKIAHLKKGVTTEDLVYYHLGSPDDIKRVGDTKLFTYRYCEFGGDGITERAPGRTHDLSTTCDFLKIEIDYLTGKMIDYEYKPRTLPPHRE